MHKFFAECRIFFCDDEDVLVFFFFFFQKWGSDHIALVSELALAKGAADQTNEVQ